MKNLFLYLFFLVCAIVSFSCQKDNFNPPPSILSGHLLYQGDTIYLEANQVPLQVYQFGFGKVGPIGSVSQGVNGVPNSTPTFAQDGSYSLSLYDGDYKIVIPNGQGPFMWKQTSAGAPDTVSVSLKGNQSVDLDVTPYYMVTSSQISAAGTDSVVASFGVQKIITDPVIAKDIEYVALYVNKTQFVAGSNNIASVSLAGSAITNMGSISLGVHVPAVVPAQSYVFARIGLKIANVEDLIFSPLIKVSL